MKNNWYAVIVNMEEESEALFETEELKNLFIEFCKEKGIKAREDSYKWQTIQDIRCGSVPIEKLITYNNEY